MEILSVIWDIVIPFILILSVLVFIHEMGHYLIARYCGVRIEAFSIGFGPEITGWTDRTGTRWKISLLPLGGYVKMFGDADVTSAPLPEHQQAAAPDDGEEETGDWAAGKHRRLTPEERAVSFHHKTLGQRSWIVAGGPLANFLFAIVVLAGFFIFVGQPTTPSVIGEVLEGSAAQEAGILPGDRIIEINGSKIERFEEIQRAVQINLEAPLNITLIRDEQEIELVAKPKMVTSTDALDREVQTALLGIRTSGTEYVRYGPLSAVWLAVVDTWDMTVGTLQAVGQIVVGDRSVDELGGPVRIAEMSGKVADAGWLNVIRWMALLSLNLGLINLFPIPVLDGGHLLFYAIEAIRGKPLGEKAQEVGFKIGMALVLSLMIFVTWNDIF